MPNPVRCFRCQAHDHVAAVCKEEDERSVQEGTRQNSVKLCLSIVGVPMLLGIGSVRCERDRLMLPGSEQNRRCCRLRK